MLSARLIHRIEENWKEIADSIIQESLRNPKIPRYSELSEAELHNRARDFASNLGKWLTNGDEADIARRYEALGRQRYHEAMPLPQMVFKLNLLDRKIREFVQHESCAQNALELYGELEVTRALGSFFSKALYYAVKGYEDARAEQEEWRRARQALSA